MKEVMESRHTTGMDTEYESSRNDSRNVHGRQPEDEQAISSQANKVTTREISRCPAPRSEYDHLRVVMLDHEQNNELLYSPRDRISASSPTHRSESLQQYPSLDHESINPSASLSGVTHATSEVRDHPSVASASYSELSLATARLSSSQSSQHRPLENVLEACLLRYFVEEMAHWVGRETHSVSVLADGFQFDLCDDKRHFQLVVPHRARNCPPLLYAIFATASCHLNRNPRYKTRHGIVYQGQRMSNLGSSLTVEYVLKCIADLSQLQSDCLVEDQENMIAAAVILRQYEELDTHGEIQDLDLSRHSSGQVNFLTITKSIIVNIVPSVHAHQSLADAAFWTAVRQEIYNAFTKERAFDMAFPPDRMRSASPINRLVMHAAEVTRWRWGTRASDEWCTFDAPGLF